MNAGEIALRCISASIFTLPVAIVVRDNLYSICRVTGPSMEPTLKDGDIVLVRKSEMNLFHGFSSKNITKEKEEEIIMTAHHLWHMNKIDDGPRKVSSRFSFASILPLPGSVIIFFSPCDFPKKYCIKRVIAQEGQHCIPANNPSEIIQVPENSVWVEGDNPKDSEDSCSYGPISKKLIVGYAERILWPLSRFGNVKRVEPDRSWW